MIDHLRVRGQWDDTIVVIASDHGEGLGEHSYYGHTRRVYQEQLEMVMILRHPPGIPAGAVVDTQVRSIDIVPTLLELAELPVPPELDGESLLPLLAPGARHPDRLAISELLRVLEDTLHLIAVSDGRYKLIGTPEGERWLYDLERDPDETTNLAESEPEILARLEGEMARYLARAAELDHAPTPELDEETERRLRALGYMQ